MLNEEDFATIRAKTTSAIADIQLRIEVAESSEVDLETSLAYIQHLLWNPSAIWQTAPLLEKQRLQRRIFPQGVLAEKTGIGTPVTHSIYTLLADDSVEESVLVAPQGFEPRLAESESAVLPLNEGATGNAGAAKYCSLTAF